MLDAQQIADSLSPKCATVVAGVWPKYSYDLHSAHIRYLNRHRLIEQHNSTHYRLTALGAAVRDALRVAA